MIKLQTSCNVDSAVISSIEAHGWEPVLIPVEVVLVGPGHLHELQRPVPTEDGCLGTSLGFLDDGGLFPYEELHVVKVNLMSLLPTFFCRTKKLIHDGPDSRVIHPCVHCSRVDCSSPFIELPAALYHSGQQPVRLVCNNWDQLLLLGMASYLPVWCIGPEKSQHGWTFWS